jgi:phage-related protein
MTWTIETLNATVDEEIEALPVDMRARLVRIAELIATVGLENVREPHIKHLEGPLWEMRLKGKDGISRALYVTARKKRMVIVRVFIKKTEKTPRREIEIALTRAKEVEND